ncbi:thermonuclease family protein [Sphingomonas sp. KRR8]|uniref:thermonuclease family protein n=1 Tax=Sphingomonas sp. KRR8 TaxID=2942996 RepID=UPI002020CC71|nr:thermonuclease family protein [Sphingomonas sp. KRR8]URD60482.1 thermonuclease family protein [Sphingomonas sp. KRR8]
MFAPRRDPNLLKPLLDSGVVPTNGYRTPADIQRLRAQGYTPAPNSLHLKGDAVDLTPGTSGLSMAQLQARAQQIAKTWPGAKVLNEGDHTHVQFPGWGMAPGTPGTPNSGLPPLPSGFQLQQRGSLKDWKPGAVHDGDTFRLPDGRNARLSGADAFELQQQGRKPDGSLVPLGQESRNALTQALPGTAINFTGGQTYGRPLVTLDKGGLDPALGIVRSGLALATPEYLQGDARLAPYMEAERLARLNRLGGFGTNAETPSQFRHKDGPWSGTTPGAFGQGSDAVFGDEATPFQGLRPEIAKGYQDVLLNPSSTADDILAYAKQQGFEVRRGDVQRYVKQRNAGGKVDPTLRYAATPRPITDAGDGKFGSFARGFGDPINMIDELGGVADSVGLTGGRENVFNSNRRFGDILWNNIDQNRSILAHDEEYHPIARVGGQLTSGVLMPFGAAAKTPLALAKVGAIEGGLAGFGAGEGGIGTRLPNAALGTALGASGGYLLGHTANAASSLVGKLRSTARPLAEEAGFEAAPIVNDGVQNAGPTPAARSQPEGGAYHAAGLPPMRSGKLRHPVAVNAAMRAEDGAPKLVGPAMADAPPPPPGFVPHAPFGVTRPMGSPLTAPEIARLGEEVMPGSVLARPASNVSTLEEAMKANPGTSRLLESPDEFNLLVGRKVRTSAGGQIRLRGPLDLTQRIRQMGGVNDVGGDLAHSGITNAPRRMDFGGNEQFLGKLVHPDGMGMDEAAARLIEDGHLPEGTGTEDLKAMLLDEQNGHRYFHPDDLNEVADFTDARRQRFGIEQAAADGSPLHEDIGQTVNLDDLAANTPPTSAYEDGPRLTGKVGNINLDRLENAGDVSQLIDHISSRVGGFDAAQRGRITHEETQKLAAEMGLKPEQLLQRKAGQALNAEQLYAVRTLAQASRQTVAKLAQKAANSGADEDLLAFRKAWVRHVAIEEQVSGATAEAGRALQAMRMLAKGGDARTDAVRAYLKGAGGSENIRDAAQRIVDLIEDPAKADHFMREGLKPTWRDKFNELWVNSLLSGPKTHVVNFVGNALTSLYSLPEQGLAAGIGKVLGSADRSYGGEVGARVSGLANSAVEGIKSARQAFMTGEPLDAATKVEAIHHDAIGGRLGKIVRLPTRALTAADEFWKTINRNAELHALAYRRAVNETSGAAERKARYEQLVRNPDGGMLRQADEAARYYTFQKELGASGKAIQHWANETPGAKIIVPFVKTPINILKFAGERSPFAMLSKNVRSEIMKGGQARDQALAKMTLGSGLSVAAVLAAMNGKVTGGGPVDPQERMALQQSGWQPYSLRVGDKWISYQRFDPLSTLFGAAADFAEIGRYARPGEADNLALALTQAVAKNVTNKTWLSGLSDAFDVLSDPQRYGGKYVQNMAGSMAVPAIAAQTAQATDPYMREVHGILEAIRARVPVLSRGLPVRRNVWGEPVERGDAVGPDILSPIYGTKIDTSPVPQEIARLRVPLSMPKHQVTVQGKRVDLNAQQYDQLVQLAGKPARTYLAQYVASPEYQAMSDEQRRDAISEAMKDFRASGVDALRGMYPELGGGYGLGDVKPLPPGFSLNNSPALRSALPARPAPVRPSLPVQPPRPASGVPPLPPGFILRAGTAH